MSLIRQRWAHFSATHRANAQTCAARTLVFTHLWQSQQLRLCGSMKYVINVLSKPGVNMQHQPELSRSPSLLLCTHSFTRIPLQSRWVSAFLVVQSGTDTRKSRDAAHQTQPPEHRSRQKSCVLQNSLVSEQDPSLQTNLRRSKFRTPET